MRCEAPTKDLLNRVFNPTNQLERQVDPPVCPKCHGRGGIWRLEQSKLAYYLQTENWYRCECEAREKIVDNRT